MPGPLFCSVSAPSSTNTRYAPRKVALVHCPTLCKSYRMSFLFSSLNSPQSERNCPYRLIPTHVRHHPSQNPGLIPLPVPLEYIIWILLLDKVARNGPHHTEFVCQISSFIERDAYIQHNQAESRARTPRSNRASQRQSYPNPLGTNGILCPPPEEVPGIAVEER